ncbi:arsenate reductase ArsC [Arthrobacter bussei]|uniref:Arsenate reductase ArsC n=1 Tax=Arthrobacter bussei TaxID=2594179 RepID=A0A7X1NLW2_9MICC|nr:arsenate reductase ArsC [Arthrobacter bussei]MPY09153.1 arsenate reductase ArsC [Arthrobacter bussei]
MTAETAETTPETSSDTAGLPDDLAGKKPSVLFVCVHNAGRSQMAAAYLNHLSMGRIEVLSAGSQPADQVNPAAVEAMREEGIDITAEAPKILTTEAVKASDVVVTMGCGDECPYFPGKRYEDWVLEDPAGKGVESVRPIRDEIKGRIQQLIKELLPTIDSSTSTGTPSA